MKGLVSLALMGSVMQSFTKLLVFTMYESCIVFNKDFIAVLLRGFAEPQSLSLDLSKLESNPLGPAVKHLYELANEGPFDVGHLIVSIKV